MSRWWFWRRLRRRLLRRHEAVIGITLNGYTTAYCGCGRKVSEGAKKP